MFQKVPWFGVCSRVIGKNDDNLAPSLLRETMLIKFQVQKAVKLPPRSKGHFWLYLFLDNE